MEALLFRMTRLGHFAKFHVPWSVHVSINFWCQGIFFPKKISSGPTFGAARYSRQKSSAMNNERPWYLRCDQKVPPSAFRDSSGFILDWWLLGNDKYWLIYHCNNSISNLLSLVLPIFEFIFVMGKNWSFYRLHSVKLSLKDPHFIPQLPDHLSNHPPGHTRITKPTLFQEFGSNNIQHVIKVSTQQYVNPPTSTFNHRGCD